LNDFAYGFATPSIPLVVRVPPFGNSCLSLLQRHICCCDRSWSNHSCRDV